MYKRPKRPKLLTAARIDSRRGVILSLRGAITTSLVCGLASQDTAESLTARSRDGRSDQGIRWKNKVMRLYFRSAELQS
jgi:hypothetical protein